VFQNGTNATTIQGSESNGLAGFTFTFTYSNLNSDVTAGGDFSFNGTLDDARKALENAGYHHYTVGGTSRYPIEDIYNVFHFGMENYRSHGDYIGDGSGHFAVNSREIVTKASEMGFTLVPLPGHTVPATGNVHFGETNPYVSWQGLGKHAKQVKRSIRP